MAVNPVPNNLALSVINTNDPVQSAPLRNDFAAIQVAVNQLIACLSGGTAGQLLSAVDGTDVQFVNNIRYRKTSQKQVVNTTTETDLLNGEFTVAAGALGTNGVLRLTAYGDVVNNTGSAQNPIRWKLKLGATTILDTGAVASAGWQFQSLRYPFRWVVEIANLGATNSQWTSAMFQMMMSGGASTVIASGWTTGEGNQYSVNASISPTLIGIAAQGGASSAVDTTVAQALALTAINPVASANLDVTLKGALVEIL